MIELRDICYTYPGADTPVLAQVSLSVKRGEFVAVMGATGCGKSTLGLVLAGIVPHKLGGDFRGQVHMDGQRGILFQNPESQLFSLYVGDDIAFGPRNAGLAEREVERRVMATAEELQIRHLLDLSPHLLSSGQKQRAALASVLAMEPEILILDEPTAFLDHRGKEAVMRLLRRLSHGGTTIVMMEHNLPLVRRFRCRILDMREGRLMEGIHQEKNNPPPLPSPKRRNSTNHSTAIEISSLNFHYPGGPPVLDNIDLTILESEFVGLLGVNGSGKTTLAKHLNGLLTPDTGEVKVFGGKPAPDKVGYAFQNPDHQLFETTVEREVAFGPANLKLPPQEVGRRVSRALDAVGLSDLVTADPHTLSAGQKRLVGIASVLALDPPVLVLDEPGAGLDRATAQTVMETLRRWNRGERTVMVLTHDTELASRFCTRVVVMDNGKLLYYGEPDIETWRAFIQ